MGVCGRIKLKGQRRYEKTGQQTPAIARLAGKVGAIQLHACTTINKQDSGYCIGQARIREERKQIREEMRCEKTGTLKYCMDVYNHLSDMHANRNVTGSTIPQRYRPRSCIGNIATTAGIVFSCRMLYLYFSNFKVPRESLLNRCGIVYTSVSPDSNNYKVSCQLYLC